MQIKKTKLADYLKGSTQQQLADKLKTSRSGISRLAIQKNAENMYVIESGEKIALYHNKRLHGDEINENNNG